MYFSIVNDDVFMNGIWQDQLLWNVQYSIVFWQEGIYIWVCFYYIGKFYLVFGGKIFQWLSVIFRNGDYLILINQVIFVGWQRISYCRGGIVKVDNSEGCCE